MVAPKPITLTTGANPTPGFDPQPFVAVGGIPVATASASGGITRAPAQANSTATDVAGIVADFNALLAKLRTAGVIAP